MAGIDLAASPPKGPSQKIPGPKTSKKIQSQKTDPLNVNPMFIYRCGYLDRELLTSLHCENKGNSKGGGGGAGDGFKDWVDRNRSIWKENKSYREAVNMTKGG